MGQHALIADPDPARAALYAGILKQEGYYSIVVKDTATAISVLLERGPPALAVVDLALGLEVIERLRRTAPAAMPPIIAVSALRAERDLATAHRVRLGLSAILAKAASEESIRRIVRRLLGITAGEDSETPSEGAARADSGVRRRDDSLFGEQAPAHLTGKLGSRR